MTPSVLTSRPTNLLFRQSRHTVILPIQHPVPNPYSYRKHPTLLPQQHPSPPYASVSLKFIQYKNVRITTCLTGCICQRVHDGTIDRESIFINDGREPSVQDGWVQRVLYFLHQASGLKRNFMISVHCWKASTCSGMLNVSEPNWK